MIRVMDSEMKDLSQVLSTCILSQYVVPLGRTFCSHRAYLPVRINRSWWSQREAYEKREGGITLQWSWIPCEEVKILLHARYFGDFSFRFLWCWSVGIVGKDEMQTAARRQCALLLRHTSYQPSSRFVFQVIDRFFFRSDVRPSATWAGNKC